MFKKLLKIVGLLFLGFVGLVVVANIFTTDEDRARWAAEREAREAQVREAEAQAKAAQEAEEALKREAEAEAEAAREAEAEAEAEEAARRYTLMHPEMHMEIKRIVWKLDVFGTVMIANIPVTNNNDFAVKDIEVKCRTSAASGTELSQVSHTIFDVVPANKTKTFKEVNLGFVHSQSERAGCSVTSAVLYPD